MPKFQVWFDHTIVVSCSIDIEASSEDDAEEMAWEIIHANLEGSVRPSHPEVDWWTNESKELEMVNIENMDEKRADDLSAWSELTKGNES